MGVGSDAVVHRPRTQPQQTFLCVCGDIILEENRDKHECAARRAPTSKHAAAAAAELMSADSTISGATMATTVDATQVKRLRTASWSLEFATIRPPPHSGDLIIVLSRLNPKTGLPEVVRFAVVDDRTLGIHERATTDDIISLNSSCDPILPMSNYA